MTKSNPQTGGGEKNKANLAATRVGGGEQTPADQEQPQPGGGEEKKKQVSRVGDFQLVKKLGQGGMGTVYLATQVSLDRKVALKTLSKDLAKRDDFVQRFLREARSMARIQHPNVVQVYAVDSYQGIHFAAIEFIDGRSMQDWMDDLGKLTVGDALNVVISAGEALAYAHSLQMIHRDIKPDNILLTKDGIVKVADFGLAKAMDEDVSMTQSGTGLGTPLYMAPEQARNAKHVDQRTDIYALGTTLYYFITGKLPFTGANTLELITAKEKGTFTAARKLNPEIPERLDLILDKALARDPQHRYTTCDEFINDLNNLGLENAGLTFVGSPGGGAGSRASAVRRTSVGGNTRPNTTPKVSAVGRTSQEDAALKQSEAGPAGNEVWYVRFTDGQGKQQLKEMNTQAILKGIKSEIFDMKAKAKQKNGQEDFRPLGQILEFADVMAKRAVKESTNAKHQSVQSAYDKLAKEQARRQRWRWLTRFFDNVKGFISLAFYLALLGGIGYGIYWGYQNYAKPAIEEKLQNAPSTKPPANAPGQPGAPQ